MTKTILRTLLPALLASWTWSASAAIRLPSILGSHMVLQRKSDARFWGWANPAEKVSITTDWDATVHEAVADSGGRWNVNVKTPDAGGPYKVTLNGSNGIVLEDVMIGEVWVCSGQSNMEWSGDQSVPQALEEAPNANNPKIRFFHIPKSTSDHPQDNCAGSWKVCTPEEMIHFSAIGYFFGKELQSELKVPVGLISSNWGGTPAEVWAPSEVVQNDSELVAAAGKLQPFAWWPKDPGKCYNAMIHPITPFAIAGAIWYQGESNTGTAGSYEKLFTRMIGAWREAWGREFPFYYVQIAPFAYGQPFVGALLREAQTRSASCANTGMVVVSDLVDDIKNIHPVNKRDVARRLANWALAETYGHQGILYRSPVFRSMEVQGSKVRIRFDHVEGGLQARDGEPTEFQIAGADRKFVPARATIEGDEVRVWSPDIAEPVAVRFGFSNTAMPNFFSGAGLPVNLFRTDEWPVDTRSDSK
jgi:sialate O-acetylesterase